MVKTSKALILCILRLSNEFALNSNSGITPHGWDLLRHRQISFVTCEDNNTYVTPSYEIYVINCTGDVKYKSLSCKSRIPMCASAVRNKTL